MGRLIASDCIEAMKAMEPEYVEIAKARIAWAEDHVKKFGLLPLDMGTMEAVKEREEVDGGDTDQATLF